MKNYLIHHGVEGQKWGVQNGPPYPLDKPKYTHKEKKELNKLVKKEKKRRKNANKYKILMDDKEIDSRVKRLENEKKMKSLTNESIMPGKTAVGDFIKKNGSKAITAVAAPTLVFTGMKVAEKYNLELANVYRNILKKMTSPKK